MSNKEIFIYKRCIYNSGQSKFGFYIYYTYSKIVILFTKNIALLRHCFVNKVEKPIKYNANSFFL